ncbi:MAG: hypothetical protein OEZ22_10145 [Spirochaetia bacterium]|nr:hypothetical protein [Spirochaetia bacterium]
MADITEIEIDLTGNIPAYLLQAANYIQKRLTENNFQCYLVGGSVRNLLINKKISDLDFATDAVPDEIIGLFKHSIPIGIEFGTVLVIYKKISIEITTFRTETDYEDGRRPSKVHFGKSLHEDVIRRDFTVNGMAYDLNKYILYDHVGGLNDLKNGIIKTIGNPIERFREDGLRPIRGCRFLAALDFKMDIKTENAIKKSLDVVSLVAPERFFEEWRKTIKLKNKHIFWQSLKNNGIFEIFFHESVNLIENENLWIELLNLLKITKPKNMGNYAAYFFYFEFFAITKNFIINQENKKQLKTFFNRIRFPSKQETITFELLQSPFFILFQNQKLVNINRIEIKKIISNIEISNLFIHIRFIHDILKLHFNNKTHYNYFIKIIYIIKHILISNEPLYLKDLDINGHDLICMGYKGKEVGNILKNLLNLTIEKPEFNNNNILKNYIKNNF